MTLKLYRIKWDWLTLHRLDCPVATPRWGSFFWIFTTHRTNILPPCPSLSLRPDQLPRHPPPSASEPVPCSPWAVSTSVKKKHFQKTPTGNSRWGCNTNWSNNPPVDAFLWMHARVTLFVPFLCAQGEDVLFQNLLECFQIGADLVGHQHYECTPMN